MAGACVWKTRGIPESRSATGEKRSPRGAKAVVALSTVRKPPRANLRKSFPATLAREARQTMCHPFSATATGKKSRLHRVRFFIGRPENATRRAGLFSAATTGRAARRDLLSRRPRLLVAGVGCGRPFRRLGPARRGTPPRARTVARSPARVPRRSSPERTRARAFAEPLLRTRARERGPRRALVDAKKASRRRMRARSYRRHGDAVRVARRAEALRGRADAGPRRPGPALARAPANPARGRPRARRRRPARLVVEGRAARRRGDIIVVVGIVVGIGIARRLLPPRPPTPPSRGASRPPPRRSRPP